MSLLENEARHASLVTVAQIEIMLRITANLISHGQVELAPLMHRLEEELKTAKRNDPIKRARRILARYKRTPY